MSLVLIIAIITIGVSLQANQNFVLKEKLLLYPYRIHHDKEYYRIFSHMFVHGDLMHLAFNMISLYSLGTMFELQLKDFLGESNGAIHFFILYFLGGILASVYSVFKNQNNPSYRSLGASGAVSAVIFASIIWNPSMQLGLMFIPIPIPAFLFGPIYLAIEYYAMRRGGTGIAHDAHLGGAFFGIIYVLLLDFEKGRQFIDLIF